MIGPVLWGVAGAVFDGVGSNLAGLKSKNINLGYGPDLENVLAYTTERRNLDSSFVPEVDWNGPWQEIEFDQVTKKKSSFSPAQLALKGFDVARYVLNGRDKEVKYSKLIIRDGSFRSPVADVLPDGAQTALFRVVLPLKEEMVIDNDAPGLGVNFDGNMAVHFAATGDEGFGIRQGWYANPLAAMDGIGSVIHIQGYYGKRRAREFKSLGPQTSYPTVQQTILMGYATVVEGTAIVKWLCRDPAEGGVGFSNRVCLTGVSLGGAMAAAISCQAGERVATAPCLPSHGATILAKGGALAKTVDWKALQEGGEAPLPKVFDVLVDSELSRNPQTQEEAQDLLAAILEAATSIKQNPKPLAPEACIIVGASGDQYCPPDSLAKVVEHFGDQCEVRWIPGGHVTGFLLQHRPFRQAVVDALEKLSPKIPSDELTVGRDSQQATGQGKPVVQLAPSKISA